MATLSKKNFSNPDKKTEKTDMRIIELFNKSVILEFYVR